MHVLLRRYRFVLLFATACNAAVGCCGTVDEQSCSIVSFKVLLLKGIVVWLGMLSFGGLWSLFHFFISSPSQVYFRFVACLQCVPVLLHCWMPEFPDVCDKYLSHLTSFLRNDPSQGSHPCNIVYIADLFSNHVVFPHNATVLILSMYHASFSVFLGNC